MATLSDKKVKLRDGREAVLRSLLETDIPAFLKYQPLVASETTFTLQVAGRVPTPEKLKAFWSQQEKSSKGILIGAFSGGDQIGSAGLHPAEPPHPWLEHLSGFGVMILKEYWGSGLADCLLEALHEHAKKVGIKRIESMVRVGNPRGVSFYKRHGYVIEGTRKMAAFIHGRFEDEYFIAKFL